MKRNMFSFCDSWLSPCFRRVLAAAENASAAVPKGDLSSHEFDGEQDLSGNETRLHALCSEAVRSGEAGLCLCVSRWRTVQRPGRFRPTDPRKGHARYRGRVCDSRKCGGPQQSQLRV